MDEFCKKFEAAIPRLRKRMIAEYKKPYPKIDYRLIWGHFETIALQILTDCLKSHPFNIPEADIIQPKGKSTYPDMKVVFQGSQYAIDVKSGYDEKKDPWYDMGRLDTYEKNHLRKYKAEYYVTVRWKNKKAPQVIDVYIEPSYKSMAYRDSYKGIYYRPYDGKIRPKLWSDFETGKYFFETPEKFEQAFQAAKIHRRMFYIAEWYREMDTAQRNNVNRIITAINAGEAVDILEEATPEEITEETNFDAGESEE
jgi:hypothetical protein